MNLCEEHPTATHFVWVATSDRGGHEHFAEPKAAHAWVIRTRDWSVFDHGWTGGKTPVPDYHTRSVLIAAREAAERVPVNSIVHFFSDVSFFYERLNEDRATRRKYNYRRSKGKGKLGQPLAYQAEWRALDDVLDERALIVSAGRPNTERSQRTLDSLKDEASQAARYIGHKFGDWVL
jgi:hypothetical protein